MAAPLLAFTKATVETPNLNLTAMTSEGGAWNIKQGTTGSDWVFPNNYAQSSTIAKSEEPPRKGNGNDQIKFQRFDALSGGSSGLYMQVADQPNGQTVYRNLNDEVGTLGTVQETFVQAFRIVMIQSQIPCGIKFTMPADQKLRTFRWYGYVDGAAPASFSAIASLSDNSVAPTSVVLNKSSIFSDFMLKFRAVQPNAVLTVAITNTAASGPGSEDYAFILVRAALLEKAVAPKGPRGFKNLQQYLGVYGGANA